LVSDLMSFSEISRSLGADHISCAGNTGFSSVSIDSRKVKQDSLFIALQGASCDGHAFVGSAFKTGAGGAIVEASKVEKYDLFNIAKKAGKDLIIVDNALKGLQNAAAAYLKKFPALIRIGITGSSGKTTTKEITGAIISCEKNTVMNEGNLNSETGMPLSAFEVRHWHEAGVFEIGTNRKGEISESTKVLKPNIAAVTNVGHAHIENFGSITEIVKEKKNIFSFMTDGDVALVPDKDEHKCLLAEGVKGKIRYYSADSMPEFEGVRDLGLDGSEITWAGEKIHFALPGKHSLDDAIAAIAIAKEVPVSNSAIKQGLEKVRPLFGRLEIIRGRTTVIRDCYNANPESTAKSIEFCDSLDWRGRRVYVIADLLELGEISASVHRELGALLAKSKADMIYLFGNKIEAAAAPVADSGKNFFYTDDMDKLSLAMDRYVQSNDIVLLKGSRKCALERLTGMLTGVSSVS
jgi:UDP-N-acetylmuramoyl-tripeptide--D-alanyl-D-alanine ligase